MVYINYEDSIYKIIEESHLKNVDEFITRDMFNKSRTSDKDLIEDVKKNKIAIYTAFTGDYDNLKDPEFIDENCDYICFTDNPNVKSKIWDIRPIEHSKLDNNRIAKQFKVLPHVYLPEYKYSFWIDSSFKIVGSIREYIYKYINSPMLLCIHPERDCLYEECIYSYMLSRYPFPIIKKQMEDYKKEGMPLSYGLVASGIMFREHKNSIVIKLMEQWWQEIIKYTYQCQISLSYILWKNNFHPSVASEYCWLNKYWSVDNFKYHHKFNVNSSISSLNLVNYLNNNLKEKNVLTKDELSLLTNDVKVYSHYFSIASKLNLTDTIFPKLYYNTGNGFNEDELLQTQPANLLDEISIKLDLPKDKKIQSVRFDPIERRLCRLEIDKLGFIDNQDQFILCEYIHNGKKVDNFIYFANGDPQLIIDIEDSSNLKQFVFTGKINIVSDEIQTYYIEEIQENLNSNIAEKETTIQNLNSNIAEKETTIQNLNENINKLNFDINGLNSKINDLNSNIAQKDSKIIDLQNKLLYAHKYPFRHFIKKVILRDKNYNY